ncbi:MAG TPA: LirA/MavJ family T4SS effector [Polyangiaceae bacterium]|nr:LirA/MavJ family T4SS effector [Polyangiaceae bacterium]
MPLSSLTIQDEIAALVPGFDAQPTNWKMTCVRIAQFLENGAVLAPNLQALETAMIALMNARLAGAAAVNPALVAQVFSNRVNQRPLAAPKLPNHMQNVLSEVLGQLELANGLTLFPVGGRSASVTMTGVVQPTYFRNQISSGRPFKDPTVPLGHGEFTHRIQWYLVFRTVRVPQGGWGAFYRWVGRMFAPGGLGLWDILFDRNKVGRGGANGPYDTAAVTDFRSPENLHRHLRHLVACPVLRGFIEGRHRKRKNQGLIPVNKAAAPGFNNDRAMRDYLSRKIFGVHYADVPIADRPTLAARTPNKVFTPGPVQAVSAETAEEARWRGIYNALGW